MNNSYPNIEIDGFWLFEYALPPAETWRLVMVIEDGLARGIGQGTSLQGQIRVEGDDVSGVVELTILDPAYAVASHIETEVGKPAEIYFRLTRDGETCHGFSIPNDGGGRIELKAKRIAALTELVEVSST